MKAALRQREKDASASEKLQGFSPAFQSPARSYLSTPFDSDFGTVQYNATIFDHVLKQK